MIKKILIVDYTTHHPEVVRALVEVFKRHRVRLAVGERFFQKFISLGNDLTAADVLVKSADLSIREWLARLAPLLAEQDIVIFSTPNKSALLAQTLSLATAGRKVLFLHNANYFLERNVLDLDTFARLRGNGWPALRQLPHYLRELARHWRKQWRLRIQRADFAHLDRRVDYYCFANKGVEGYFREQSGHLNTVILPTNAGARAALESVVCPPYRGRLNIAIIGMVSQQRKDYLQTITALLTAKLRRPITLSLLGSCPDPEFAQQLATLIKRNANPHLEIRFNPSQKYIPTPELIELLGEVHLLLSPIHPDTSYQFYREIYGVSKVSGSEGDCLAYKRPLLLPQSYRCADYVEPAVVHYADMAGLISAINELNDDAALAALYSRLQAVVAESDYDGFAESFLRAVTTPGCADIAANTR